MKGRKPKPLAKQLSDGDTRKIGVHKLEAKLAAEPKASRGLPPCPSHVKGRARAAWRSWAEELAAMGLDRRPDAQMLEGACTAYAQAVEADLLVSSLGMLIEEVEVTPCGPCGGVGGRTDFSAENRPWIVCAACDGAKKVTTVLRRRANPALVISRAAWAQVRAFCSEFGLSPVSRTRLAAEPHHAGDEDLMALLSMPRADREAAQDEAAVHPVVN